MSSNGYVTIYARHALKNGALSNVDNKFISRPNLAQHTLSAAGTVRISHALPVLS
jgi:hypothetical protein